MQSEVHGDEFCGVFRPRGDGRSSSLVVALDRVCAACRARTLAPREPFASGGRQQRTMATIAILGTGLLGSGMAENLLAKGHTVRVWNRTASKCDPLQRLGAIVCDDPASCVRGASRAHLVLTSDDAVDAVLEPLRKGLAAGVAVYDHSTNLPERVAARIAAMRSAGVRYVSAPVFMSPRNAREASGMILLSGDAAECAEHATVLQEMTGKALYVGERPDLAAFHKISGNGLLIGLMGLVGDLLAMGRACGIEASQVLSLYEQWNPASSISYFGRAVSNAGSKPATFELQMARKDIGLMLQTAAQQRMCVLPSVAAAMDAAVAEGRAHQDYTVFARPDR